MEVGTEDEGYPPLLGEVRGRPKILYVRGDKTLLEGKLVAVVGSRLVSRRGIYKAREVVRKLVKEGYVVVSGLARGVDTVVHEECLRCGGKTVAVLAHGLDWIYPQENRGLAARIVEHGGALVSPLPLGVRPQRGYFPWRNRIMVGMSLGVVVVEAQERSGSITTANWAGELGRQVWVVRGSRGTEIIYRDGAAEW